MISEELETNRLNFIFILLVLIIFFMLTNLWLDTLNKFYYNTLGFDPNNALDAFILAFLTTLILISIILIKFI